jgi:hypothetical protein
MAKTVTLENQLAFYFAESYDNLCLYLAILNFLLMHFSG